jgi:hypothetical protein
VQIYRLHRDPDFPQREHKRTNHEKEGDAKAQLSAQEMVYEKQKHPNHAEKEAGNSGGLHVPNQQGASSKVVNLPRDQFLSPRLTRRMKISNQVCQVKKPRRV